MIHACYVLKSSSHADLLLTFCAIALFVLCFFEKTSNCSCSMSRYFNLRFACNLSMMFESCDFHLNRAVNN